MTAYNNNKGTQNRKSLVLPAIEGTVLQRFSDSGYLPEVMMKKQMKSYEVGKDSRLSAVQIAVGFPQPTVKFQINELYKLQESFMFF